MMHINLLKTVNCVVSTIDLTHIEQYVFILIDVEHILEYAE